MDFWASLGKSIILAGVPTLCNLISCAIIGYGLARFEFPFKKVVLAVIVFTFILPSQVTMIPTYALYSQIGILGTILPFVVPPLLGMGINAPIFILIFWQFFRQVPKVLIEAAQIDGAGYFTIFTRIISPLCKPVYATVALFVAVGQWNSWFDAMLYNRMKPEYTTLQYELMKLLSSVMQQSGSADSMKNAAAEAITPVSIRAAATMVTMLPIVCIYPFLQRYFVTGLTIGGVKE